MRKGLIYPKITKMVMVSMGVVTNASMVSVVRGILWSQARVKPNYTHASLLAQRTVQSCRKQSFSAKCLGSFWLDYQVISGMVMIISDEPMTRKRPSFEHSCILPLCTIQAARNNRRPPRSPYSSTCSDRRLWVAWQLSLRMVILAWGIAHINSYNAEWLITCYRHCSCSVFILALHG